MVPIELIVEGATENMLDCEKGVLMTRHCGRRGLRPVKGEIRPTVLVVLALLLVFSGCDAIEQYFGSWDGYVYPDRGDLTEHVYIGRYKTLDDCRVAARRTIARVSDPRRADYECGLNCKPRDGINVCSRTER
jgi:hypothetical protein